AERCRWGGAWGWRGRFRLAWLKSSGTLHMLLPLLLKPPPSMPPMPSLGLSRSASRVLLFWAAFILPRPLGATVGDYLDKPLSDGGLALSRPLASAVIAGFILLCLLVIPQRAGTHPETSAKAS